jgi:aminopeptidase
MVPAGTLCHRRGVNHGDGDRKGGPPSSKPPKSIMPPSARRSTPIPTSSPTLPPAAADDANARRGAANVIQRCLCVTPGERVHLMTYRADAIYALMARAVEAAGATPVRIDLDGFDADRAAAPVLATRLSRLLAGATATILIAPERPSAALSMAVAQAAEQQKARHLHLLQIDERLLAQSMRADPDLLATVNDRLAAALKPPCQVRVTSDAGTSLDVRLALAHPILSSNGRPAPGASENLPAGAVYTHPARVTGTLVVDRAIFGPGFALDRAALRRAPARVRFGGNRVTDVESADPAVAGAVETYLASHADAGRVGILVFPTNYLVRFDVGIDRQDMLLPSMNVSLGFANAAITRASYEAPVQIVLLGRRQTVEVDGRELVVAGRLAESLVEGIDPFR